MYAFSLMEKTWRVLSKQSTLWLFSVLSGLSFHCRPFKLSFFLGKDYRCSQSSFNHIFNCRNLTRQVARSVAAASSISFNQPSPAAIAVYSHVRHQPSQNAEAQSTSILNRAKHEILRIIDLMVEKTQQEVVDLLTDVCTAVPDTCEYISQFTFYKFSPNNDYYLDNVRG